MVTLTLNNYHPQANNRNSLFGWLILLSQDMKCCTMWYLEAIRRLKERGAKFSRTVHLTVVPGEFTDVCQSG